MLRHGHLIARRLTSSPASSVHHLRLHQTVHILNAPTRLLSTSLSQHHHHQKQRPTRLALTAASTTISRRSYATDPNEATSSTDEGATDKKQQTETGSTSETTEQALRQMIGRLFPNSDEFARLPEEKQWKHIKRMFNLLETLRSDDTQEAGLTPAEIKLRQLEKEASQDRDIVFPKELRTPEVQKAIEKLSVYFNAKMSGNPMPEDLKRALPEWIHKMPRFYTAPYELAIPDFANLDGSLLDADQVMDQIFHGVKLDPLTEPLLEGQVGRFGQRGGRDDDDDDGGGVDDDGDGGDDDGGGGRRGRGQQQQQHEQEQQFQLPEEALEEQKEILQFKEELAQFEQQFEQQLNEDKKKLADGGLLVEPDTVEELKAIEKKIQAYQAGQIDRAATDRKADTGDEEDEEKKPTSEQIQQFEEMLKHNSKLANLDKRLQALHQRLQEDPNTPMNEEEKALMDQLQIAYDMETISKLKEDAEKMHIEFTAQIKQAADEQRQAFFEEFFVRDFRTAPTVVYDSEGDAFARIPEGNIPQRNAQGQVVPQFDLEAPFQFSTPQEKFWIDPFFDIWTNSRGPTFDEFKQLKKHTKSFVQQQERMDKERKGDYDEITMLSENIATQVIVEREINKERLGMEDEDEDENEDEDLTEQQQEEGLSEEAIAERVMADKAKREEIEKLKQQLAESAMNPDHDILTNQWDLMSENERASWVNRQMTSQSTSQDYKIDLMCQVLSKISKEEPGDKGTFLWKTLFPKDEWEGYIDEKEILRMHKMQPAEIITEYMLKQNISNNPFANFLKTLDPNQAPSTEDAVELLKQVNVFDFMAYNMMLPTEILESIFEEIQYQYCEYILQKDPLFEMFPLPPRFSATEMKRDALILWFDAMREVNPEAQKRILRAKHWKRNFIPSTVAFELYAVHKKDREFWTPERLARAFGVPKTYAKAAIILKDQEEAERRGEPYDKFRNLKMFKLERERHARRFFKHAPRRVSTTQAYEDYVREMSIPAEADESSAYLKSTFTPYEPEQDDLKEEPPMTLADVEDFPGIPSAKKNVRYRFVFAEVGKRVKADERRFIVRDKGGILRTATQQERQFVERKYPYSTKKYK